MNTGGRYAPSTDAWAATSTTNAPSARDRHTAVWTGTQMIIWGGQNGGSTGGRYCSPLTVTLAASRKNQGGTNYDIPLPLSGFPGIECRGGGGSNVYQIVVEFPGNVTFDHASIASGSGSVTGASGSGTATVTIDLSGVLNQQTINVTIFGVNDGSGAHDLVIPMGVLVGDTTGNGQVNSSDVAITKLKVGRSVTPDTCRYDVTANGTINASDTALIKSMSGTSLP